MTQIALHMLSDALLQLTHFSGVALFMLALLLTAILVVGVFDRDRLRGAFPRFPQFTRATAACLAIGVALFAGVLLLQIVRTATDQRFTNMQSARGPGGVDSDSTSMTQSSPVAVYFVTRTYRRTLALPSTFESRITPEGLGVLAPYLNLPPNANLKSLVDSFTRSGSQIVFSREQTVEEAQPIRLDSSTVNVTLENAGASFGIGRQYFNATFDGKYELHNPSPRSARVQFSLPLPAGSGTLSDAQFVVDGKAVAVSDLSSGYTWSGMLEPDRRVQLEVSYKNQGTRGWSYQLSQRREPVASLDLTVNTNRAPNFARYSVSPTSASYRFGGDTTLKWQLRNVVTAQDIGLVFSSTDTRETLVKMLDFAPISLLALAVFVVAMALRLRERIDPVAGIKAIAGFALGLAVAGVLSWYVQPPLGVPIGCAIAAVSGVLALGRRYAIPAALAAATPIAFLFSTNTSILMIAIGISALWLLGYDKGAALLTPG